MKTSGWLLGILYKKWRDFNELFNSTSPTLRYPMSREYIKRWRINQRKDRYFNHQFLSWGQKPRDIQIGHKTDKNVINIITFKHNTHQDNLQRMKLNTDVP